MPGPYTQAQLDATWATYIACKTTAEVIDAITWIPGFEAQLGYIFQNKLYGWADYNADTPAAAGSNVFPGSGGSAS